MTLRPVKAGMPDAVVLSTMTDDLAKAGVFAGGTGASGVHPVASTAYFYPVILADKHTYTTAWWLNGAAVAGNVDVGIYTIAGATATRVVASTALAQSGISALQKAATFTTTTVGPGLVYLAISESSASAQFWRNPAAAINWRMAGCFQAATSHPLPASATVVAFVNSFCPVFGFAESAAI